MTARKRKTIPSVKRKRLGLVQFDALPAGVFLVASLPLTEAACKRHINSYAKENRIKGGYTIAYSVSSASEVVAATIDAIEAEWKPFAYGTATRLYEGTVRKLQSIWKSVIVDHPAALLLELGHKTRQAEEREERIRELEAEIRELQEEVSTRDAELNALRDAREEIKRLRLRAHNLRLDNKSLEKKIKEGSQDGDKSALPHYRPTDCEGSYDLYLEKNVNDGFCICPKCGMNFLVSQLHKVSVKSSSPSSASYRGVAGRLPPHTV